MDGDEWPVSRPDRFVPGEIIPDTHWPGDGWAPEPVWTWW